MNSPRSLLGLALACVPFVAVATEPPTIGLYSDVGCTSSALTVETGATATFYVAYSGPSGLGLAQFRIDGLPAGWPVIGVTPNPGASVVIGDPFGDGTKIGFGDPRFETACLNLLTIQVQAASVVSDHILAVAQHRTPSNQDLQCPSAVGGEGPFTWQICVVGGELLINPSVSVSPGTWSQMKSLHQ